MKQEDISPNRVNRDNDPTRTNVVLRHKFEAEDPMTNVHIDTEPEMIAPLEDAAPRVKEAYLEKIAEKKKRSSPLSGKLVIILGSLFAVLVLAEIFADVIGGSSKVKNASGEALGQRMANLQTLVKYGVTNRVSDSKTNKVISEANLILLSRTNELAEVYATDAKTGFSSPSEEIAAQYSIDDVISKLDSAKANSNLDSAYASALETQLDDTMKMLENLYDNSQSEDVKTALSATYSDFAMLKSRLTE